MRTKSFFAAAVCAVAVAVAGAGAALAGEVQGPPGTPGVFGSGSGNQTGAFSNSKNIFRLIAMASIRAAMPPF